MAALAISVISAQDLSSKWRPEGCSSKLLDQSLVSCNRPNLSLRPINPRRAKIGISKRQITVRAGLSENVGRSNSASIFVGGFILGGIMAGALGCIYAPKVSKAFAGADKKDLMRKLPKFIYDEDKALEEGFIGPASLRGRLMNIGLPRCHQKTRKVLEEKIAQLNSAIDGVSSELRAHDDGPNGAISDEIEASI